MSKMSAVFRYRDSSRKQLINDFAKYIDTVTPFFTVEDEIMEFMNEKGIDYFKVSRKHSTINRDIYFKFNETIEDIHGSKIKFFTYDRVYVK